VSAHPDRTLDRVGAAAGFAAVALLLAIFMILPALPAPDQPVASIARAAHDDASSLLRGAYLGTLMGVALLAFGAAFAAALRRSEGAGGGWWLLALAGIAGTSVGLVADAAVATFVRAVGHGVAGDTLWIGYGLDHWIGVLMAAPLGLFVLAASLGARATGLLPRWLAWAGIVIGPLLIVGAGSITGDEVTGGALGMPIFFGYLLMLVWIVASSICLWRGPQMARATAVLATDRAS
jgi:hypothetical protein